MSEQVGKHKGAVETLLHEKKELSRLLQIVNSQLERHMSALEEAGVDTEQFIQEVQEQGQQKAQQRKQQAQNRQQKQNKQRNRKQQDTGSQEQEQEDKEDADELLEGEDDFSDRDFSPR